MNIASILATKGGQVMTIRPEQTVREAVASLVKHDIGALIVVNDVDKPIGIITERHIVREVARNEQIFTPELAKVSNLTKRESVSSGR